MAFVAPTKTAQTPTMQAWMAGTGRRDTPWIRKVLGWRSFAYSVYVVSTWCPVRMAEYYGINYDWWCLNIHVFLQYTSVGDIRWWIFVNSKGIFYGKFHAFFLCGFQGFPAWWLLVICRDIVGASVISVLTHPTSIYFELVTLSTQVAENTELFVLLS